MTTRDQIIRILTPGVMKAFNVDRELGKELLARLSPDERSTLYKIRGMALGLKNRKQP